MKALGRRLLKLESRFVPLVPPRSNEPTIADQIREQRRLRCEREGRAFTTTPPEVLNSIPRGLTIAARMRWHRDYRRAASGR